MARINKSRQRLCKVAGALFSDRGYHAVGVQEICRAAGVNKGSFYYFFPSKQRLVIELIEARARHDRQLFAAALAADDPPVRRLARLFESLRRDQDSGDAAEPPCVGGSFLGHLAAEAGHADQAIRAAVRQAWADLVDLLEPVVRQAWAGAKPPADPAAIARTILACIEGGMLLARTYDETAMIEQMGAIMAMAMTPPTERPTPSPARPATRKPRVRLIRPAPPMPRAS